MSESAALHALAEAHGVHTSYTDGLGNLVEVGDETLRRICAALGAPAAVSGSATLSPVLVAWDGELHLPLGEQADVEVTLHLEQGETHSLAVRDGVTTATLPLGYHRLTRTAANSVSESSTVIAAPVEAWRRPGQHRSWGIGAQLAALRSHRSRSLGDLRDLEQLCRWLKQHGADMAMLLPLLPTFNTAEAEPSPYSPVSRLFWSELIVDLGAAHHSVGSVASLDVARAHQEVWQALAGNAPSPEAWHDAELVRYARFRGAQATMGRNWRAWPASARDGDLHDDQLDHATVSFHMVAQGLARQQLTSLAGGLQEDGFRLGMDLTVGVHSDGYDAWSRQHLFAQHMSVGAPPDPGFPSGQDWGFAPLLPSASRREGHRYVAASLAHQMAVAGVLRVDHVMAWSRLYWIPQGMGLHEGTYVSYPAEELFAVLTLESQRHQCEVVGENLGTVPEEINAALARHRIRGLYLAQFHATGEAGPQLPAADDASSFGSHDTPTVAGWIAGEDIEAREAHGLLAGATVTQLREGRAAVTARLAEVVGSRADDPRALFLALLHWLGASPSELVIPWLENLWLEVRGVNLPGTTARERPNWQRPMRLLLEEMREEPLVLECLQTLASARRDHA